MASLGKGHTDENQKTEWESGGGGDPGGRQAKVEGPGKSYQRPMMRPAVAVEVRAGAGGPAGVKRGLDYILTEMDATEGFEQGVA